MSGRPKGSGRVDHERVEQLTRSGRTAAQIAEVLGCSSRHVVRIRSELGISRPVPRWLTPAEVEHAEQLLADGCSVQEIERSLDRKPGSLQRRFRGRGWTVKQASEYANLCLRMRDVL
jgi:AraC-like DNA-binding protein